MTERVDPPYSGKEKETLQGFLEWQRATLMIKCADLTPDQLAERPLPPSTLSLLGLVRHLAEVERGWFGELAHSPQPDLYATPEHPDLDFDGAVADKRVVRQAFADWNAEVARARQISDDTSLKETFVRSDGHTLEPISHRWVLIHMIEEYARHNGHADLLREQIDGRTGE